MQKLGIQLYYQTKITDTENWNTPILFDEEWVEAVHDGSSGTSPYLLALDNDYDAFTIHPNTKEWIDNTTTITATM
jgi:hypothetical protein